MVVAELLTKLGFQVDSKKLTTGITQAKSALSEFKSFVGKLALGYGFLEIGKSVLNAAAEMESMNAQFEVMLGSAEKGGKLMERIQKYAAETSFETPDVAKSIQTLLQFGMDADVAFTTMQKLGDVAGANKERFGQLSLAMAQISSAGKLQGQDLNQLINGGWNPLRAIAEMTHKPMKDLRKEMEKGAISYEMVSAALDKVTSVGGMFYQNQMKQAKTWAGVTSTAMDNLKLNASKALQQLFPIMKTIVGLVGNIPLEWLGGVFKTIADSMYYVWSIAGPAIVDMFSQIQEAFVEFGVGVSSLVGGAQGAGDSLHTLAVLLRYLITRFMVGIVVILRFSSFLMQHKALLMAVGFALVFAFGPSKVTMIANITRAMNLFRGSTLLASLASMKNGIAMSFQLTRALALASGMGTVRASFEGARASMNNFAASSQLAMGALVAATGWAIGKIVEAYNALQELLGEQEHQDRMAQIAELSTQRGLNIMAARKLRAEGKTGEANRLDWRNLGIEAQIKDLRSKDAPAAGDDSDKSFDEFKQQMAEEAEKSRKLQEQQLEEMKKQAAATKGLPSNIAISLHNKAGEGRTGMLPDDVLKLSEKAIRAAFNVQLQRAAVEAE